jgi:hypothetical protein
MIWRVAQRLTMAIASLALISGCDAHGSSPTAPSEPRTSSIPALHPPPADSPGPASSSVLTGAIEMVGSSPASGASLSVATCRFGAVTRTCAEGWVGTFNVHLSRELRYPVLTVLFYSGEVLCGYAADVRDRITAGQTVAFHPSWISLSDEYRTFSQPCPLPAQANRLVAVLWSDVDWATQIRREFTTTYTFVHLSPGQ